jgi:hypothetical protein
MAASNTKEEASEVGLKVLLEIMRKEVLTSEYWYLGYSTFELLQKGIGHLPEKSFTLVSRDF